MTDNTNIEALLRSWDNIEFKKSSGEELTAIEQFIYDNEPAVDTEFHAELKAMLEEAIEHGRRAALSNAVPVAWLIEHEQQNGTREKCALMGRMKDIRDACDFGEPQPLFLHPSVPAPLRNDQIKSICRANGLGPVIGMKVAKAIEQAHGIGLPLTNTGEQG